MFGRGLYSNLPICGILVGICFAYRLERFIVGKSLRLQGHLYNVTAVPSDLHCCVECIKSPVCLATNFNPTTGECQLCDETPEKYGTDVETDATWNMYYVPGPCEAGWIYYGTSCYWLETGTATWSDSAAHCATLGARLLEINDQQENDFLHAVILSQSGVLWKKVWHGLNDIAVEQTYMWPSGDPVIFMNFGPGEGIYDSEDCVGVGVAGTWGDLKCGRLEHSMCEIDLL